MRIELGTHLNQIGEIAQKSYDDVYSFGSLKSFPSQRDASTFVETEISKVSGGNDNLVIERGVYEGLPTLVVRLYAAGRGRTPRDREIESFKQGFMVFKVREGSSIIYKVNYAT